MTVLNCEMAKARKVDAQIERRNGAWAAFQAIECCRGLAGFLELRVLA